MNGINTKFTPALDCLTASTEYGNESKKTLDRAENSLIVSKALVESNLAIVSAVHALTLAVMIAGEPPQHFIQMEAKSRRTSARQAKTSLERNSAGT